MLSKLDEFFPYADTQWRLAKARLCCLQRSPRRKAHGCFSPPLPQTQQWQQTLSLCTERVLQAGLVLLSLFFHPTFHCLSSTRSSGKSSRQVRKVKRRDTACFLSVVSDLALVRSWPIWNARKMWTKPEMCWRAAGFKSVPVIREHTFMGQGCGCLGWDWRLN